MHACCCASRRRQNWLRVAPGQPSGAGRRLAGHCRMTGRQLVVTAPAMRRVGWAEAGLKGGVRSQCRVACPPLPGHKPRAGCRCLPACFASCCPPTARTLFALARPKRVSDKEPQARRAPHPASSTGAQPTHPAFRTLRRLTGGASGSRGLGGGLCATRKRVACHERLLVLVATGPSCAGSRTHDWA